jgi:hypothetical protein
MDSGSSCARLYVAITIETGGVAVVTEADLEAASARARV